LGFGFAEIGSVLPDKHSGNPEPRIKTLQGQESIVNNFGYFSEGIKVLSNQKPKKLSKYILRSC
jgi:dihydroorotate dehydrogenase